MRKKVVWLPYDLDTAIGINNEGALVFSYNLEDTDHTGSGANIFNGQDSVMWTNLRDAFGPEIKEMYQTLRSQNKLSYVIVEQAFENHQNKWPEAIFNEDSWFKYLQPLVDDGDASYLSMLQGSKAEQRKWWLYNRFRYIDSKYNAGDALTDVITLRGYAKSNVAITPYADVYASVKYGSYLVQTRATRNQSYTLVCPLDEVNDTEIYIYSASQLASVGDLSGFKVGYANFSMATKLQSLKIGDNTSGYSNGNLTELYLGNNTLLRSIDVRNCPNLTMPVDISGCTNIEHVYFGGTAITGLNLPNGGILKTLQVPDTMTNLTIRNQPALTTFTIPTGANITTLRLENIGNTVDSKAILMNLSANSRVRLICFSWSVVDYAAADAVYDKLDTMRGLSETGANMDTAQAMGTIHIPSLTGAQMASLLERYPDISVTYDHLTSYLYYYNGVGDTLLYTETITDGADGTYAGTPTKTQDAQYTYAFAGWATTANQWSADANATKAVTADRNVYAAYTRTVRTYTVLWKNGTTTIETDTGVAYGTTPTYNGSTPTSSNEDYVFSGWDPAVGPITGDTTYTAVFVDTSAALIKYLKGTMTSYESSTATTVGTYAFYNRTNLVSATTTATSIGEYAFSGCSGLKAVDLTSTSPVSISANAFSSCNTLEAFFVRSTTVSTLANSNGLPSAPFMSGKGVIYVPSDLVGTYRTTSPWSRYASRIFSISAYPVTDFSTISDTWSEIFANEANGTYSTKYSLGDTKKITINNKDYYAQIVAFDADPLSDNSGNAKITWILKELYDDTHIMNATATNANGWPETEMRTWLNDTILPLISSDVRTAIKEVTKTSYDRTTSADVTSNDKLWIPSAREVFTSSSYGYESSGPTYTTVFNSSSTRTKYKGVSANIWWLRSAYRSYTTDFQYVYNNGTLSNNSASIARCVCLGFCT